MALGLLYVRLFVPSTGVGFDALADALGGMIVGSLVGLVAGGIMVARLEVRRQWMVIGVWLAVTILTFAGLALTARERGSAPLAAEPDVKKSFQPTFRVGMRVSHTREILARVGSDEHPLPFTEAEVSTGKPELVLVGWGPDFNECTALPSESDLTDLVPRIRDAMAAAGSYCRTKEEDLKLAVNWNLAGDAGTQGLDAGCLAELTAVSALADAIGALGQRLCR